MNKPFQHCQRTEKKTWTCGVTYHVHRWDNFILSRCQFSPKYILKFKAVHETYSTFETVKMYNLQKRWKLYDKYLYTCHPGGSVVKNLPANAGHALSGLIPVWERSPGKGNGNPLQYSCLGNSRTEEPGGLQSVGSKRVRHDLVNNNSTSIFQSLASQILLFSEPLNESCRQQCHFAPKYFNMHLLRSQAFWHSHA